MRIASEIPAGEKFNRLLILEEVPPNCRVDKFGKSKKMRMVKCKCDCGNIIITRFSALKNGTIKSCSCWRNEQAKISQSKTFTKHGLSNHRLFRIWSGMKTRCYDIKCKSYKDYGGRGITICDEWLNDFFTFYEWSISHGYKTKLQIDRINNDGNYCSENCRWVTKAEQAKNRRSNRWIEFNGEKMLLCDWATRLGVGFSSISNMLKKKSVNETLNYYTNKYLKSK